MKLLADTNFLIYLLQGLPAVLPFLEQDICVSYITEIELLGKKDITTKEKMEVQQMLSNVHTNFGMTDMIKSKTIALKQQMRIKTPDAIIAATALTYQIPLITADRHFERIQHLDLILLNLEENE